MLQIRPQSLRGSLSCSSKLNKVLVVVVLVGVSIDHAIVYCHAECIVGVRIKVVQTYRLQLDSMLDIWLINDNGLRM